MFRLTTNPGIFFNLEARNPENFVDRSQKVERRTLRVSAERLQRLEAEHHFSSLLDTSTYELGVFLSLSLISSIKVIRVVPADDAYSFGIVQPHVLWQIAVFEPAAQFVVRIPKPKGPIVRQMIIGLVWIRGDACNDPISLFLLVVAHAAYSHSPKIECGFNPNGSRGLRVSRPIEPRLVAASVKRCVSVIGRSKFLTDNSYGSAGDGFYEFQKAPDGSRTEKA